MSKMKVSHESRPLAFGISCSLNLSNVDDLSPVQPTKLTTQRCGA